MKGSGTMRNQCSRTMAMIGLALCAVACGSDQEAITTDRALILPLEGGTVAEGEMTEVASRQREFFGILLSDSREDLSEYLAPDFVWNRRRGTGPNALRPHGDADYLKILGGWTPPSLTAIPTAFDIRSVGQGVAQVYSELPDGESGILMVWRFKQGAWQAVDASDLNLDLKSWQQRLREFDRANAR